MAGSFSFYVLVQTGDLGAMTPKDRQRRISPPRLSEEDEALWRYTTRTLEPLRRAKAHVSDQQATVAADKADASAPPREEGPSHQRGSPSSPGQQTIKSGRPPVGATPAALTQIAVPSRGAPTPIDPAHVRKIRRGRLDIEARIDLHGMRQAEAHAALYRFIKRAHAAGKRWVLVITGKGGPRGTADEGVPWDANAPERGVLKRNVPLWLAEAELRALIVSFSEAAPEHGGSGALYVHLRRSDRVR